MRAFLVAVLAAALAGCADADPSLEAPIVDAARDDLFILALRSPADHYAAGKPIEVVSELTYQGPKMRETVYHAASPIGWQVAGVDGGVAMSGVMPSICTSTGVARGVVVVYPFQKSGVIDDAGPFDAAWFHDPALRLPAGQWRVTATFDV